MLDITAQETGYFAYSTAADARYEIVLDESVVQPLSGHAFYCRSDCVSGRPHAAPARRFRDGRAAARAGLRPCGWCRPEGAAPRARPGVLRLLRDAAAALIFLP